MPDIPQTEPTSLRAGDTWAWQRQDLATDYPASTWALTYTLINADTKLTLSASASGDIFNINVTAANSAAYRPGVYNWIARVSSGATVTTVGTGMLEILPDLASQSAHDGRTHAKKVLDAIESVIEGRASLDQQEVSIAGRTLRRTPIEDLLALRNLYQREVRNQEAAEKLAKGMGVARTIGVRF